MSALISIEELVKTYGQAEDVRTPALKGVNLSVNKGAFVCIAGPSGSGKTTLLNLIGALDKPTGGKIFYEDREMTAVPISQLADFRLRQVGFVFQAFNLINTLTALENVEYIMLLQGRGRAERVERSRALLKRVGLDGLAHKRPNQMSGGQQQRVAVARAIAAEPSVVLADEPTANLDSATAVDLIDLMRELNREKNVSFIFSTHDQMVMDKADGVFHIKDGKIIS